MSTIAPGAAKAIAAQLAERGVRMLDAPVSGGEVGAIEGTLTIMVGGDEAAFHEVLPFFEAMGKKVTYVGASGAGQVAKACNQVLTGVTVVAVAEASTWRARQGSIPLGFAKRFWGVRPTPRYSKTTGHGCWRATSGLDSRRGCTRRI
jgi:2-hydroxy-3-oxopropionate reductase